MSGETVYGTQLGRRIEVLIRGAHYSSGRLSMLAAAILAMVCAARAACGQEARLVSPQDAAADDRLIELVNDDGKATGKRSMAGVGHAARFRLRDKTRTYITAVRIHGARYGTAQPPREYFHVWLGATQVPGKFVICLNFQPTSTKGVFVSHDKQGDSLVGLPGKPAGTFRGGDWLIRATVKERK
jgi:hypothetical protein